MLRAQQIEYFRNNGYVAEENFFDKQELTAMLSELERFKRKALGLNVLTAGDAKMPSLDKVNYANSIW